jgi:hypothetical protein
MSTGRLRAEATHGHVLDMDEVRQILGIVASNQPSSAWNLPRTVILVDHNFRGDFEKTVREVPYNLRSNEANVIGVIDTQRLAEDTSYSSTNYFPLFLGVHTQMVS